MMNIDNFIGKEFNNYVIMAFDHKEKIFLKNGYSNGYRYYFKCKCKTCGAEIILRTDNITNNKKKNIYCRNCYTNKISSHKLTKTRLYKIWGEIKRRCLNPNSHAYKLYGGRGVTICPKWKDDFMSFYDWAINNGYKDNLSIDRINVNGNYEPLNCRWATQKEQANNKRTNHFLTLNNTTKTISEWSDILKISAYTLYQRKYLGWSDEKTLNTPVRNSKQISSKYH